MGFLNFEEKAVLNVKDVSGEKKVVAFITSNSGEALKEIEIRDENSLISAFGLPTSYNKKMWWNVWNFLQYASNISVFRVIDESSTNTSLVFTEAGYSVKSRNNFYNSDVGNVSLLSLTTDVANAGFEIINREVTNKEDLYVAICSSEENFSKQIFDERIFTIKAKEISKPISSPKKYDRYCIYKEKNQIIGIKVYNSKYYLVVNGNKTFTKDYTLRIAGFDAGYNVNGAKLVGENSTYDINNNTSSFLIEFGAPATDFPSGAANFLFADADMRTAINTTVLKTLIGLNKSTNDCVVINTDVKLAKYKLDGSGNPILDGVPTSMVDGKMLNIKYSISDTSVRETYDCKKVVDTLGVISLSNVLSSNTIFEFLYDSFNDLLKDAINVQNNSFIEYSGTAWSVLTTNSIVTKFPKSNVVDGDDLTIGVKCFVENISKTYTYTTSWTLLSDEYIPYKNTTTGETEYSTKNIFSKELFTGDKKLKTFKEIASKTPNFASNECMLIVLKKTDGLINVAETYIGSYDSSSIVNNKTNFIENIINENSSLVYLKVYAAKKVESHNSIAIKIFDPASSSLDYSNITDYVKFDSMAKKLEDKDKYQFDILMGFECLNNSEKTYEIFPRLASVRQDCIAIVSPFSSESYFGMSDADINSNMLQMFSYKYFGTGFQTYSTYTAVYANMKLQNDKYANTNIWSPITGDICGLIVLNIKNKGICEAPAGSIKAKLLNISGLLYSPSEARRKDLTDNNINSVIFDGTTKTFALFDSLTCEKSDTSIFRNLHVRLFLNDLKNFIRKTSIKHQFGASTEKNLKYLAREIDEYVKKYVNNSQIEGGGSYFDRSKNSISELGQGNGYIDVYVKFFRLLRSINFSIYTSLSETEINESEV